MKEFIPSYPLVLDELSRLGYAVYVRNKRQTDRLINELSSYLGQHNQSISPKQEKRIRGYCAQVALLTRVFTLLRGYPPTEREYRNAQYLAAYTPVLDDLMDDLGLKYEELLSYSGEENSDFRLFQYLDEKMKTIRGEKADFDKFFIRTLNEQDRSLAQLGERQLSSEEIQSITFDKGGYSVLLVRCVLDHDLAKGEEETVYHFGSLAQLMNDIYDVYKDSQEGLQTMVTASCDFNWIEEIYKTRCRMFRNSFFKMEYSMRNVKRSFVAHSLALSRAIVALEYYKALQAGKPRLPIEEYSRKPLIVDMEKLPNFWRSIVLSRNIGR
ncbi:MAG: hypothetical protein HWE24_10300 [Oceanospirillaceae bacterium]|nr:hypothetical protein [Oceanospirillaceae bacterium]